MKKLFALSLILTFVVAIAALTGSSRALAVDGYPKENITVYCGYTAGAGSDYCARMLAAGLTKHLGVTAIVENLPGSGGWVLWSQILSNPESYNDGYTVVQIATPNWSTAKYDTANPRKYGYDSLDLVANMVSDANCIAIRADETRFTDFESFIEYWKKNSLLSSANATGVMSDDATMIKRVADFYDGLKYDMVQTGGGAESINMLMNGSIDFQMGNVSEMAKYHNNEFKILCVFAKERQGVLAEVKTFGEITGTVMTGGSNRGFAIPKGVPADIRKTLVDAICAAITDPEIVATMAEQYTETNFVREAEYDAFIKQDMLNYLSAYGIEP